MKLGRKRNFQNFLWYFKTKKRKENTDPNSSNFERPNGTWNKCSSPHHPIPFHGDKIIFLLLF